MKDGPHTIQRANPVRKEMNVLKVMYRKTLKTEKSADREYRSLYNIYGFAIS
jgi:hypothetical protein